MKLFARSAAGAFVLFAATTAAQAAVTAGPEVLLEGSGIEGEVSIGSAISSLTQEWGKADRVVTTQLPDGRKFISHEYHGRGVLVGTDGSETVRSVSFFCQKSDTLRLPRNATPFTGRTSRGLELSESTTLEQIYLAYGEPNVTVFSDSGMFDKLVQRRVPFNVNDRRGGMIVVYPTLGISFSTFRGLLVAAVVREYV